MVSLTQLNASTPVYSGNTIQLTPTFNYGTGEISWTDGSGNLQRRTVTSPGTPSFQDTPTRPTTVYTLTVKYQDPTTVRPNELTVTTTATVTLTAIDITTPALSLVASPAGPVASGTVVTLTPTITFDPNKLRITKSEVSTNGVSGSTVTVTSGTPITKTITTNSTFTFHVEYVDIRETPNRTFSPIETTATVNTGPLTLTQTGSMTTGRSEGIALLLPSGKVLVAGGTNNGTTPLKTAELYDPISKTWTPTGSMSVARRGHTATLLLGGKVLVTGGFDGAVESTTAELYDPATGLWTPTGAMVRGRKYHTASRLIDGSVLIAGGIVNTNTADGRIAELFNPITATFTSLSTNLMSTPRSKHTATVLPNGKTVVLAGGFDPAVRTTTEVFFYDTTTATDSKWAVGPALSASRHDHTAIQVAGTTTDILLIGGYNNSTETCTIDATDTAATITASSSSSCSLNTATMNFSRGLHTSTQLDNGKIVVIGGTDGSSLLSSVEVLATPSSSWAYSSSDPILKTARAGHTSVLLSSQKILVTGSMQTDSTTNVVTPTAELWEP